MEAVIPKIFHQIWLNGEMPDAHKYFRDHMLELHPGWEYKFWTESNRPRLFNEEYYKKYEEYCFKSDILRYEILLKYGGVYSDTDNLFLKNIEPCIKNKPFLTIKGLGSNEINNSIMGFPPNHSFLQYLVYKIPQSYIAYESIKNKDKSDHYYGLRTVGPRFIDRIVKGYMPEIQAQAYENKYFLPFSATAGPQAQYKKYPEAYVLHLWNYSEGSKSIQIHKTLPCYKRINNNVLPSRKGMEEHHSFE